MTGSFVFKVVCETSAGVANIVSHRLFLEPIPLDRYWMAFLMPLIAAVCIVYKTIKLEDITLVPRSAGMLALQIILFMVLAAAVLWLMVRLTS